MRGVYMRVNLRLLPGVPRPQDLTGDFRWIGARYRLELLHATGEAVGDIQIPELIGRHPVGAAESPRLSTGSAPAVQVVAVQIELEDPIRWGVAHPDEPVLID